METNAKKLSFEALRAEFSALGGAAGAGGAGFGGGAGGSNSNLADGAGFGAAWCGFIQMSDSPVMIIGGADGAKSAGENDGANSNLGAGGADFDGGENGENDGDEVAGGADDGAGGASQSWQNATALPSWDALHNGANFINEAQLFRAKVGGANSNLSAADGTNGAKIRGECVTIRHFNGEFWFSRFDLDDLYAQNSGENGDKFEFEPKIFVALDGRAARFLRVWEAVSDENCEGLAALTPAGAIFVGFAK